MKESLLDIIKKHRNWYSVSYDINLDDAAKLTEIDIEMSDAANLYADSLHTDRWQIELKNDIQDVFTKEPPSTRFNREMAERHTTIVELLVSAVKRALRNHAFDISQLDRITKWRLGEDLGGWAGSNTQIEDGLTKDEANSFCDSMRKKGYTVQYFRELCSNLYTVLAFKDEAKPEPQRLETLKTDKTDADLKRIFEALQTEGFISPESRLKDWLTAFGRPTPQDSDPFRRIVWIKKNEKRTKQISKKSLLDLLKIMRQDLNNSPENLKKLNSLFEFDAKVKGFVYDDLYRNEPFVSCYHADLEMIVNKGK